MKPRIRHLATRAKVAIFAKTAAENATLARVPLRASTPAPPRGEDAFVQGLPRRRAGGVLVCGSRAAGRAALRPLLATSSSVRGLKALSARRERVHLRCWGRRMDGASTASRAASSSVRGFEAALRRMRPLAGAGAAVRAGCRLSSWKAADVAPHNTSSDIRCTPRHRAHEAGAPHGPVAHCKVGRVARTTPVTRRGTGSVFLGRPSQRLVLYAAPRISQRLPPATTL